MSPPHWITDHISTRSRALSTLLVSLDQGGCNGPLPSDAVPPRNTTQTRPADRYLSSSPGVGEVLDAASEGRPTNEHRLVPGDVFHRLPMDCSPTLCSWSARCWVGQFSSSGWSAPSAQRTRTRGGRQQKGTGAATKQHGWPPPALGAAPKTPTDVPRQGQTPPPPTLLAIQIRIMDIMILIVVLILLIFPARRRFRSRWDRVTVCRSYRVWA